MVRLPYFLRRRPPPEALDWACRSIGDGANVVAIRRLRGGSSAALHALDIRDRAGRVHKLVLRRFVRADWLAEEPDVGEKEARVLRLLASTDIPAPELVAVDADGSQCDVPAVLMSRLPGRLDIMPSNMESWLTELAAMLPRIHAVGGSELALIQPYAPYKDMTLLRPPYWSRKPAVWTRAIEIVQGPVPAGNNNVFIHRDYHPMNVLWSRGRLSAVIDWTNASVGPPGIDLAHCRVNLVVLFGVEIADRFSEAYRMLTGARQLPYWDLIDLCDGSDFFAGQSPSGSPRDSSGLGMFHDAGRRDLSQAGVRERLDDYVESIVRQL